MSQQHCQILTRARHPVSSKTARRSDRARSMIARRLPQLIHSTFFIRPGTTGVLKDVVRDNGGHMVAAMVDAKPL
jgi:hypothetical protein